MANNQKPSTVTNPVGGSLEPRDIFEYGMESIFRTPPVNEGPVSAQELNQMSGAGWAEIKAKGLEGTGSLSGFQKPRRKEHVYPELGIRRLQTDLAQAHQEIVTKEPVQQKRIKVNTEIGGISNILYEDTVNDAGEERIDVKTYVAQAQLEAENEARLKESRENQVALGRNKAKSTKGTIGPTVDLNTDFENRNASGKPG